LKQAKKSLRKIIVFKRSIYEEETETRRSNT